MAILNNLLNVRYFFPHKALVGTKVVGGSIDSSVCATDAGEKGLADESEGLRQAP